MIKMTSYLGIKMTSCLGIIVHLCILMSLVSGQMYEPLENMGERQPLSSNNGTCLVGDPIHCRCDALCSVFDECCAEKKAGPLSAHRISSCSSDLESLIVDRCPLESRDRLLVKKCEENTPLDGLVYALPVHSNNILFKNRFCARCNDYMVYKPVPIEGVSCTGYLMLNESPKSSEMSPAELQQKLHDKDCKLNFLKLTQQPFYRKCKSSIVSECYGSTNETAIRRCKESPMWLSFSLQTYRSPACCECNSAICNETKLDMPMMMSPYAEMPPTYDLIVNIYSWCGSDCNDEASNSSETNSTLCSATPQGDQNTVLRILTFIFCLLSIFTLIAMIATYSYVRELRNFGGMMSMALSIAILAGQILFLIAPNITTNTIGCSIISGVMHFWYLSSFLWMALFAFDLLRTFYGKTVPASNPLKRFAKFTSVGFFFPLAIVFICFLLDAVLPDAVISPVYGTCQCWFNQMWGGILWFFLPVVLVLVFNGSACIAAFVYLHRAARDTRQVRSQTKGRQSMFFLCLKLTGLFGIFWVLQIVSIFIPVPVLTAIVGLVNSLQGFLIGVCFMATNRVRKVAKDSISRFTSSAKDTSVGITKVSTLDPQANLTSKEKEPLNEEPQDDKS